MRSTDRRFLHLDLPHRLIRSILAPFTFLFSASTNHVFRPFRHRIASTEPRRFQAGRFNLPRALASQNFRLWRVERAIALNKFIYSSPLNSYA